MFSFVALLFTVLQVHAAEGPTATVKDIDVKNMVLSIEPKSETKPGDRWAWSAGDESCLFQVYTVRKTIAQVRAIECDNINKVKVGQTLKMSFASQEATGVTTPKEIARKATRKNPELPTDNERWYLLLAGGMSGVSYKGVFKEEIKAVDDLAGGTSRGTFSGDIGFFWPLANDQTMLGVNVNLSADTATNDQDPAGKHNVTISEGLVAFSAHHFFGPNIGSGWFARADVGVTQATIIVDAPLASDVSSGKTGFGALIGGGYGIAIGNESRLLFNLTVSPRFYGKDQSILSTLGIGFLL